MNALFREEQEFYIENLLEELDQPGEWCLDSEEGDIKIHYVGAPRYKITVTSEDYKTAELEMKGSVERIASSIEKHSGSASFKRKEEK